VKSDCATAIAEGAFSAEQLQGTLAEPCRRQRLGRTAAAQGMLCKLVSTAWEDLAAAELVGDALARARA
jgi:ornithine cyclodeaminase